MDPDGSDLRRSVRERRATTVKYNGFTVKVNNQYTLEEGERSVFDEEMGEVMVMDSNKYDRPLEKKPVVQRVPRVMSKEEKGRKDSNDQLKAITERLEQRRRFWLRCHLPKLEGWVPEKELRKLREDRSLDHAPEAVERLEEQPESIRGVMKEYQLKGISFMARMVSDGVGCILADEMGLGKTLQTIALIAWMKIHRKEPGPCLVVVPLSVISSWIAEFKKWCPTLKVARLHSSDQSYHQELARNVLTVGEDSPDVVLTTYDMVKSMQMLTMKLNWRLLVLDEGHLIKNDQTGRAAALRRVRACSTVLLTGTPLQNNLVELWALLSFLNPIFTDKTPFESAFTLGVVHNADTQAMDGCSSLLRLFCLRRVKREVEVNLPPLIETRVECPLSSLQTFWYRRLLLREYQTLLKKVETDEGGASASAAGDTDTQETGAWKKLQALFIQLRKCCNHPYLFPSAEPFFDGSTGEDLVEASGKLAVLDRLLAQLYAGGHRVVLFSQFKMMLDIFEDMLQMRGYAA